MRLGKTVKRLEARAGTAAAAAKDAGCAFVIAYSGDDVRVEAAAGELVAMDVYAIGGARVRTVERVTLDPSDLGFVYDSRGDVVGRVVEVDPPYFSYCTVEGCEFELGCESDTRGEGGGGGE